MGHAESGPSISEVAAFLDRFAPQTATRLKGLGPEYANALKLGLPMGSKADQTDKPRDADEPSASDVQVRIKAEVLAEALKPLVDVARDRQAAIDQRLRKLSMTKFVSGLLTALSAPGTVLLLTFGKADKAMLSSLLAFLGSMVQLGASTLLLGPNIKEADLVSTGRTLGKTIAYADLTAKSLDALLRSNVGRKELEQALKDANRYFGELNEVLR